MQLLKKEMQEKESIMVDQCELNIPSLRITVQHHLASFRMPNSYPRDGIFNLHLTTIKDFYSVLLDQYQFGTFLCNICRLLRSLGSEPLTSMS